MPSKDYWEIKANEWLDSLEDMNANAECPEEELTTFEQNLMDDLRRMLDREKISEN